MRKPIRSKTPACGALLCAAGALIFLFHCSPSPLSGGGTEGGNVTGMLIAPDGGGPTQAQVQLIPETYDPVASNQKAAMYSVATASDGSFSFLNIPAGGYAIQAVSLNRKVRALITGITVVDRDVGVPVDTMKIPGAIKIFLPATVDPATGYLYVPGTTISAMLVRANGFVVMDSIPAGTIPAVYYASRNAPAPGAIRYAIKVPSKDTAVVACPEWKYAKQVLLNTTPGGAGVTGNVAGFPLLIRLTSGNFYFSQAQANGGDIRFAKSDTALLKYEIERWDAAQPQAEIWVRIDTVFGNNAAQSIMMYWGNPNAADSSNGAAVFDTADGWAGVWHLREDAPDTVTAALYRNSVEHANYGDDKALSNGKTGMIGKGQNFTWSYGPSDIHADRIQVLNATSRLKPQQVTLSGWMQVFRTDSCGSEMASMGDNYLIRVDTSGRVRFVVYSPSSPYFVTCWDSSANFADSSWHYYVGSYDGKEARLYVDGVLRSVEPFTAPVDYSRGQDFVIGGHGTHKKGYNIYGNLDEINCSSIARSSDWVRLMFENQKTNGKIISIMP